MQRGHLYTSLALRIPGISLDTVLQEYVCEPSKPLAERTAFFSGMLKSLLLNGRWQEAISQAFEGKAKAIFEYSPAFDKQVIESIESKTMERSSHNLYINEKDIGTLCDHLPTVAYHLIEQVSIKEDDTLCILDNLGDKISVEQKDKIYTRLGDRATQREDTSRALDYYAKGHNKDASVLLYSRLLESPVENFDDLMICLTRRHAKDVPTDPTEVVQSALKSASWEELNGDRLYSLIEEYHIPLESENKDRLLILAARDMREQYIMKTNDTVLQVRWAKQNAARSPFGSYSLLVKHKITCPERIAAARAIVMSTICNYNSSNLPEIEPTDARQVYDLLENLKDKVALGCYLNDPEILQTLSMAVAKSNHPDAHKRAYNLAMIGKMDQNSPFLQDLREKSLAEAEECGDNYKVHNFLYIVNDDDKVGCHWLATKLLDKNPHVSYEIAHKAGDSQLLDVARVHAVQQEPFSALAYFIDRSDVEGQSLAITALAKRFELDETSLSNYITSHRRFEK